jgi:hypothetical protein
MSDETVSPLLAARTELDKAFAWSSAGVYSHPLYP